LTQSASPGKKIAHFKIKGELVETPVRMPPLFGTEPPLSLKSLLARFKEARHDDNVVAVVVDLHESAMGLAQLEEIREAMGKFAAVDKEVYVHADALSTLTYAAATGASHVSVVPTGELWLLGLYGEMPYLRGTLEKIGVMADFEQCGDFKTAAEPLTRLGPSEEAQEMNRWLLDSVYETIVGWIASGRGMHAEKVRNLIDNGPYFAAKALEAGLIDSVKHRRDFVVDLKSRYGAGVEFVQDYGKDDLLDLPQNNPWAIVEFFMKMLNPMPEAYSKPTVAVVYVEGTILPGEAEASPFAPATGAFSTTIRKALDKAAKEPAVKAVVLRVDSPGGSALASEIILDSTKRVAGRKPLIVSMGNVAGSGGYYVSCGAEAIFADAGTITASIGVLGGKLVTTGMWDKLGVNWHAEQRGDMAAMMSTATPFSDSERAKLRHHLDTIYEVFKKHVTEARGNRLTKPIDEIAGGRVFTGRQALNLGLVDKLGGFEEAIKAAAQRAGLSEYDIRVIPEPPTIFDLLLGHLDDDDEFARQAKATRLSVLGSPLLYSTLSAVAKVDPLRTRAILRCLQGIELIHKEGVAMIMLPEPLIR
jgi:protease-4